jgi:hypothetical protein
MCIYIYIYIYIWVCHSSQACLSAFVGDHNTSTRKNTTPPQSERTYTASADGVHTRKREGGGGGGRGRGGRNEEQEHEETEQQAEGTGTGGGQGEQRYAHRQRDTKGEEPGEHTEEEDTLVSASNDVQQSMLPSLCDVFTAIASHSERFGVFSPREFVSQLRRRNGMCACVCVCDKLPD